MADERYNGWANYPTWCVNLWLSNDESLYMYATEQAERTFAEYEDEREAARMFAQWLSDACSSDGEFSSETASELTGLNADLLTWALKSVDWDEIADRWIAEAKEAVEA
jgi:hypothetical protein